MLAKFFETPFAKVTILIGLTFFSLNLINNRLRTSWMKE